MEDKIIELKGHYENQEWVWDTEIDKECNNFILKLNGDLTPLFSVFSFIFDNSFYNKTTGQPKQLFIPKLPNDTDLLHNIRRLAKNNYGNLKIYTLDNEILLDDEYIAEQEYECNQELKNTPIINIIPNWSKYIDKNSLVLFLNENCRDKYKNFYPHWLFIENTDEYSDEDNNKKISIIIPSIDLKNIEQARNITKELKEKYGIEYVEVIDTHCFLHTLKLYESSHGCEMISFSDSIKDYNHYYENGFVTKKHIDKIITTNSTGVLEIQDTERLKVIDCVEFFEKQI